MNRNRATFRIAAILANVAIIILSATMVVAQNQKREVAVNGRDVTILLTVDPLRAAESLRIVTGNQSAATYSPYIQVVEVLKRFDEQPAGRRIVLLMSDGLDVSQSFRDASPMFSLYLDQAISEAQRRRVAIFSFYAPSVGLTSVSRLAVNYGQGSLNRVADETGGEAFFSSTSFVTFDPCFRELNDLLNRQWLITYRSTNTGAGFRRLEATTDFDLHLHHPSGYRVGYQAQSRK
jgi:hypothetical protein